MILLTDEEATDSYYGYKMSKIGIPKYGEYEKRRRIAKAQLKKVVGWGEGHCEHDTDNIPTRRRHKCSDCWQELLKEAGLDENKT